MTFDPSTMAALIGRARSICRCPGFFQPSQALSAGRRFKGIMASVEQTLDVKRRIDETRKQALLGGGLQRIETQHKKVADVLLKLCALDELSVFNFSSPELVG